MTFSFVEYYILLHPIQQVMRVSPPTHTKREQSDTSPPASPRPINTTTTSEIKEESVEAQPSPAGEDMASTNTCAFQLTVGDETVQKES